MMQYNKLLLSVKTEYILLQPLFETGMRDFVLPVLELIPGIVLTVLQV
jgi:hypothetical protein